MATMLNVAIEHAQGGFRLAVEFAAEGGVTALFGRSGSGKTTLVNAIAGLLRPQRGSIRFDGETLFDADGGIHLPPQARRFGYVFQEGRLFPHLTVRHNLTYSGLFSGQSVSGSELDRVVGLLGLESLLERRPGALSGGEKQRVAIGRALLARPRLLLLDEPLAALDTRRKSEILRYLELLRDEFAVPMLYVSHAVEEVVRLASNVVLLSDGRVEAAGPTAEIMSKAELRPLTGRYEGGAVIEARVAEQDLRYGMARLEFAGGSLFVADLDALAGEAVRVRIRARDVALALQRPEGTTFRNIIACRVSAIADSPGSMAEVSLDAGGATIVARITRQSREELALQPGLQVYALIKAIALDRHAVGYA
ncbi:MAG: molybdenum ABC transporter ATP-binding protein [Betaproteobacteria bacterium]|jgi:molybdate transport system ATP-binding protein